MKNIQTEIQDNILIIKIDLNQSFGQTKSGKSELIGTTAGNVPIAGGRREMMTVTVYKPKAKQRSILK